MSRKIFALIVALLLGLSISWMVYGQLNRYRSELDRIQADLQPVVVVTRDLETHTKLGPEDLKVIPMLGTSIPAGKKLTIAEALGKCTVMPMSAGDVLTPKKLALNPESLTMAFQLSPGTLAIAVPIDEVVAAGGFVHPGDMVDLIHVTRQESDQPPISRLLLSQLRLLAMGKDPGDAEEKRKRPKKVLPQTALLQVTPREATIVAWAQSQGSFWLALRPSLDNTPSHEKPYKGPDNCSAGARTVRTGTATSKGSATSTRKRDKTWSIEMISPGQLEEIQVPIN